MSRPEFSSPVPYDVMSYIYQLEEQIEDLKAELYDPEPGGPYPNWGDDDE